MAKRVIHKAKEQLYVVIDEWSEKYFHKMKS